MGSLHRLHANRLAREGDTPVDPCPPVMSPKAVSEPTPQRRGASDIADPLHPDDHPHLQPVDTLQAVHEPAENHPEPRHPTDRLTDEGTHPPTPLARLATQIHVGGRTPKGLRATTTAPFRKDDRLGRPPAAARCPPRAPDANLHPPTSHHLPRGRMTTTPAVPSRVPSPRSTLAATPAHPTMQGRLTLRPHLRTNPVSG